MLANRSPLLLSLALSSAIVACGDDTEPNTKPDIGTDAGDIAVEDAGGDVSVGDASDAGTDTGADAGTDTASPDVATDATRDATADASEDASVDTTDDTTDDAGSDAAEDIDTTPAELHVRGTITLTDAPLWLGLSIDGEPAEELLVDAAGDYEFATVVTEGAAYEVTLLSTPHRWFCAVDAATASGTAGTEDVIVDVPCEEGAWAQVEFLSGQTLSAERLSVLRSAPDTFAIRTTNSYEWGDGVPFVDGRNRGYEQSYRRDGVVVGAVDISDGFGPDALPFTDDDGFASYWTTEFDAHGNAVLRLSYTDPGDDAIWFTDDDTVGTGSQSTLNTYDDEGRLTCSVTATPDIDILNNPDGLYLGGTVRVYFDHPTITGDAYRLFYRTGNGPDGLTCTADDVLSEPAEEAIVSEDGRVTHQLRALSSTLYSEEHKDEQGRTVLFAEWERSGDGIGGPGVDTVQGYATYNFDPTVGPPTVFYSGPGPDATWFTDDDTIHSVDRWYQAGPGGSPLLSDRNYLDGAEGPLRGPDGVWGTEDDLYRSTYEVQSPSPELTCRVTLSGSGPDGLWQDTACGSDPGDNEIASIAWARYDADGRPTRECTSVATGPDGLWLTNDDTPSGDYCASYTYVTDDIRLRTRILNFGADGLAFTDDDARQTNIAQRVNSNGHVVLEADLEHDEPGDDGVWFTSDDAYYAYRRFTVDRAGKAMESQHFTAGPDGLWLTEDDTYSLYTRYETVAIPHAVWSAWD